MRNAEEQTVTVQVHEEDDDDDGPPPGFLCIIAPPPTLAAEAEAEEGFDEEEDGPPPGFHSIASKPTHASPDSSKSTQQETIDDDDHEGEEEEVDDDDDGPPPGWEIANPLNITSTSSPNTTDIKTESDDDLEEGPPPGWETVLPNNMTLPFAPPQESSLVLPSSLEIECKLKISADDDKVTSSESEPLLTPSNSSQTMSLPVHFPTLELHDDFRKKSDDENNHDNFVLEDHTSIQKELTPPFPSPLSSSEKGQLVCGTCRKLCLYPIGTKWVQCPSCKEINFVLEEHEVGQVYCGGCSILLMYPHTAPVVQCSSCQFVTEIGEHNRQSPHLSKRAR